MPGIDHTTYILLPIFKRIVGKDKLWKYPAVAGYPYGKYLAGE